MGSKDILEKHLENHNDVFADMINVFIFNGEEVLSEDDLEDINPNPYFVEEKKTREQERDVSKKWVEKDVILSFLGIENQTTIDPLMPFRVIGYDGVSYKYMLANEIPPCPVLTIVLNFSMKRWTEHRTLLGELNVSERLKPFINDYKINVIDVAHLSRDTVNKFKSDFKIVADYFVQMRETKKYVPMTDDIKHVWDLLNLMSVLTGDDRFKITYYQNHREERTNMCEVLDRIEAKGIAEGMAKGIAKGIAKGRAEGKEDAKIAMVKRMAGKYSNEEIANLWEISVSEVEEIIKGMSTGGNITSPIW